VLFRSVYSVFLRACVRPEVTCPNSASSMPGDVLLTSLTQANLVACVSRLAPTNSSEERTKYANELCGRETHVVQPMCVDDIDDLQYDKRLKQQCRFNYQCSRSGVSHWHINEENMQGLMKSYVYEVFNDQLRRADELENNKPLDEDDFSNLALALQEIQSRDVPHATMLCIEQATPPTAIDITHIARARSGYVEDILDFGSIDASKQVAFVAWGGACDNTQPGVTVQPFPIKSRMDLAFHTYGSTQRRFSITVPSRTIGQSFYHMCERSVGATTYTKVTDAVYVFGEAAGCGSPDCSAADFTSKMDNSFVTRLYFTLVTAATIGYGDISPSSTRGRLAVVMHSMFMLIVSTLAL